MKGNVTDKVESAFEELHRLHIVHGDVRAANILIAVDKSVWLIDFEFAQVVSGSSAMEIIEGETIEVKRLLAKIRNDESYF